MSFTYSITKKPIPDAGVYLSQLQGVNPAVEGFHVGESAITVSSSQEIYAGGLAALDAVTPGTTPLQTIVETAISSAMAFGHDLVVTFAAENVLLGITQAGKTSAVRHATAEVTSALITGSLYDAIAEAKAIPSEDKDATFVTDARLLAFINKIESYLNIPLSTEL